MHLVDRGPEPAGLEQERHRYTGGWIRYAAGLRGTKPPNDSAWRQFHPELQHVFKRLCGYCEEITRGEVDHFRPKKRFPELTYVWSNWVFACHSCNLTKRGKWPASGYVDPCAKSQGVHPESHFEFDTSTGKMYPKTGLSPACTRMAEDTKKDLGLNDPYHLVKRLRFLRLIFAAIPEDPSLRDREARELSAIIVLRSEEMSSIARSWLAERG